VTERCKLKVEKNAKKASSSLFCDSDMSQDNVQVGSLPNRDGNSIKSIVYGIRQEALI
jgi:hypothetical protein